MFWSLTHEQLSLAHIETSQLICSADQVTGFCMKGASAINAQIRLINEPRKSTTYSKPINNVTEQGTWLLSQYIIISILSHRHPVVANSW